MKFEEKFKDMGYLENDEGILKGKNPADRFRWIFCIIKKVIIFHHRHLAQKLFLHTQKSIIVYFLKLQIMLQLNINNICKCEN